MKADKQQELVKIKKPKSVKKNAALIYMQPNPPPKFIGQAKFKLNP